MGFDIFNLEINFTDKFYWQIKLTNFTDNLYWQTLLTNFTDKLHWQTSLTNFTDKLCWQTLLTNFTSNLFAKISFEYIFIKISWSHETFTWPKISNNLTRNDSFPRENPCYIIDFLFFWECHAMKKLCEVIALVSYSISTLWYY